LLFSPGESRVASRFFFCRAALAVAGRQPLGAHHDAFPVELRDEDAAGVGDLELRLGVERVDVAGRGAGQLDGLPLADLLAGEALDSVDRAVERAAGRLDAARPRCCHGRRWPPVGRTSPPEIRKVCATI
jgi:hypothetical protein